MEGEKTKKSKRRWLVLLAAHVTLLVCGASYRCFGIFLVEWRKYFNTSSAEISAIMTFSAGSMTIAGLIAGPLLTKFSSSTVLFLSASIMVCGTISSVFADTPLFLCLTLGLFSGIGVGLSYTSSQVVVAHHFKKGYSRANGIASSGVGLGIIFLPPFFQYCIEEYGWRGTLLFLAGIQAQVFVASFLCRTPSTSRKQASSAPDSASPLKSKTLKEDGDDVLQPMHMDNKMLCVNGNTVLQSELSINNHASIKKNGCVYSTEGRQEVVSCSCELDRKTMSSEEMHLCNCNPMVSNSKDVLGDEREHLSTSDTVETCPVDGAIDCRLLTDSSAIVEEVDISSVKKPVQYVNGDAHNTEDVDEAFNLSDENSGTSSERRPSRCQRFLKASGWILFGQSLGFCLVIFCQIAVGLCYTAIMTHFVASTVYAGIDKQSASFLLSALGIASMIARLGNGWFVDREFITPEHLYVLAMTVFGGSTILSRAYDAYGWFLFIAVLLGASSGIFKCVLPVVFRKIVGVENLAPAMGVSMIFMGAGDLLGPIFAGALYDANNSYDTPFYVAGSLLMVSAFTLFLERPLMRCKDRYQAVKSEDMHVEEALPSVKVQIETEIL